MVKRLNFSEELSVIGKSGKIYKLSNEPLSVERYIQYEKLQIDLGVGVSFDELYKKLNKSVELANGGKGIEAWNIILNLRDGVKEKLNNRSHPALHICALFLVAEGEDTTKYDKAVMDSKVDDIKAAGYSMQDFFQLGFNLVSGLVEALQEDFRNISETAKKVTENQKSMQNEKK